MTVQNRLSRPIAVRGLVDRSDVPAAAAAPAAALPIPLPAFAFAEPLIVEAGESREARFTPTADVSSFYYAHAVPPGSDGAALPPFGALEESALMGALVVDPAVAGPPPAPYQKGTRGAQTRADRVGVLTWIPVD